MKPFCRLCESYHDSHQAHVFANPKPLDAPVADAVNTESKPVNTDRTDRHRPGYMREYMKARRAIKSGRAMALKHG